MFDFLPFISSPVIAIDLPSFLWLWRIAAWSMGLTLAAYGILALSGWGMRSQRLNRQPRPDWLRPFHYGIGIIMVSLVLLLLGIGIVGTLGEYGSLGHSVHLAAGLLVVLLVLFSAFTASQISYANPWARVFHVGTNIILFVALSAVSLSGWSVVQKYLP